MFSYVKVRTDCPFTNIDCINSFWSVIASASPLYLQADTYFFVLLLWWGIVTGA